MVFTNTTSAVGVIASMSVQLNRRMPISLFAAVLACGSPEGPGAPTIEWVIHTAANSGLPNDWVTNVAIAPDRTIWIGTFDAGIARLSGTDWVVFTAATSGLPSDEIRDLAVDRQGALWVATSLGVARFDGSSWTVYDRSNTPFAVDHVYAVAQDQNGVVWVGGGNVDEGGLYVLEDGIWTGHTVQNSSLPCGIVEDILVDEANRTWVGTSQCAGSGGVVRIENDDWTVFTKDNSALRYNAVETLASDGLGNIWAGSSAPFYLDPGVLHGSLARFGGQHWEEWRPAASGGTSNRVTAVEVDHRGRVWVATSVEEPFLWDLAVLDGVTWTVLSDVDPAFPTNDVVWDMADDADRGMWIASAQGLLVVRLSQ